MPVIAVRLVDDALVHLALRCWEDDAPPVERASVAPERHTLVEDVVSRCAGKHEPSFTLGCIVQFRFGIALPHEDRPILCECLTSRIGCAKNPQRGAAVARAEAPD